MRALWIQRYAGMAGIVSAAVAVLGLSGAGLSLKSTADADHRITVLEGIDKLHEASINAISAQIVESRREMLARFDRLDSKLDAHEQHSAARLACP